MRTNPVKIVLGCVALVCVLGTAIALGSLLTGSDDGTKPAAHASADSGPAEGQPNDDPSSDKPSAKGPVLRIDGPDGPVTPNEITSLKAYVQSLAPAKDNIGNNWAQGGSGQAVKAMGRVY
ncbi:MULTISPECIES: hypothetical protein [unclassified Streptomyces]|uniref:hypothetical protein n=1 Tax=unclassified Streptomyces TaxID=2593676 RepID=UPI0037F600FD